MLNHLLSLFLNRKIPIWALVHVSLFVGLVVWSILEGLDRSGWILITQPVEPLHAQNTLFGYSFIREGQVFHKENFSSLLQVAFFSGAHAAPDMYFRRPVYSFFAAILSPFSGVFGALILVNILAWASGAYLCYRLTCALYRDDVAALWASLFAITGTGFVLHGLDLSAHLLSFVFYMAGVVLIYESGVWKRELSLRDHLRIAIFLMIACLQYNTGICLVVGYFIVSLQHNRLRHVILATIAALLAQPLWGKIIALIYQQRSGIELNNLSQTEYEYFTKAIHLWAEILQRRPTEAIGSLFSIISSFAFFEMPLVILTGSIALMIDYKSSRDGRERVLFALPYIITPIVAALTFATYAKARGYLIFGISIFFYASLGMILSRLIRSKRSVWLPSSCILLVISLLWNTSHFFNYLGPAKAYFLGLDYAEGLFRSVSWNAVSLTGIEPTPRTFGGSSTLSEAGLSRILPTNIVPEPSSFKYALYAQALFVILTIYFVKLVMRFNWHLTGAIFLLLLTFSGLSTRLKINESVASIDQAYQLEPGDSLKYKIELSSQFHENLTLALREGKIVALFCSCSLTLDPPEVRIGSRRIPLVEKLSERTWLIDSTSLLASLTSTNGKELEIQFHGVTGGWLGGWQSVGLPGRYVIATQRLGQSKILPAVEIRLLHDKSLAPMIIGF